ncbi:general transcription factor II-I repeat domain-containing protein 2A [Trichonephila clavipes]|nr:general transcription factor II-I repeat domain-containing protein 2A [Trichonephila clavipes]
MASSTKKKVQDSKYSREFQTWWADKYGMINKGDKAVCVYVLEQCKNCHTSAASYSAANAIARHGKPFKRRVLKEAWLACAPSLFDDFDNKDKIIQRIKDVPLSRNTMTDRILKLAENVTDQQKNDINSAPFISLCLDESIDTTKSARLAVFARYCVENIIKEELIAITSLLTTTKGTDICTAFQHTNPVYRLYGSFSNDPLTSQIMILIGFSSDFQKHPYDSQVDKKGYQPAKMVTNSLNLVAKNDAKI